MILNVQLKKTGIADVSRTWVLMELKPNSYVINKHATAQMLKLET